MKKTNWECKCGRKVEWADIKDLLVEDESFPCPNCGEKVEIDTGPSSIDRLIGCPITSHGGR